MVIRIKRPGVSGGRISSFRDTPSQTVTYTDPARAPPTAAEITKLKTQGYIPDYWDDAKTKLKSLKSPSEIYYPQWRDSGNDKTANWTRYELTFDEQGKLKQQVERDIYQSAGSSSGKYSGFSPYQKSVKSYTDGLLAKELKYKTTTAKSGKKDMVVLIDTLNYAEGTKTSHDYPSYHDTDMRNFLKKQADEQAERDKEKELPIPVIVDKSKPQTAGDIFKVQRELAKSGKGWDNEAAQLGYLAAQEEKAGLLRGDSPVTLGSKITNLSDIMSDKVSPLTTQSRVEQQLSRSTPPTEPIVNAGEAAILRAVGTSTKAKTAGELILESRKDPTSTWASLGGLAVTEKKASIARGDFPGTGSALSNIKRMAGAPEITDTTKVTQQAAKVTDVSKFLSDGKGPTKDAAKKLQEYLSLKTQTEKDPKLLNLARRVTEFNVLSEANKDAISQDPFTFNATKTKNLNRQRDELAVVLGKNYNFIDKKEIESILSSTGTDREDKKYGQRGPTNVKDTQAAILEALSPGTIYPPQRKNETLYDYKIRIDGLKKQEVIEKNVVKAKKDLETRKQLDKQRPGIEKTYKQIEKDNKQIEKDVTALKLYRRTEYGTYKRDAEGNILKDEDGKEIIDKPGKLLTRLITLGEASSNVDTTNANAVNIFNQKTEQLNADLGVYFESNKGKSDSLSQRIDKLKIQNEDYKEITEPFNLKAGDVSRRADQMQIDSGKIEALNARIAETEKRLKEKYKGFEYVKGGIGLTSEEYSSGKGTKIQRMSTLGVSEGKYLPSGSKIYAATLSNIPGFEVGRYKTDYAKLDDDKTQLKVMTENFNTEYIPIDLKKIIIKSKTDFTTNIPYASILSTSKGIEALPTKDRIFNPFTDSVAKPIGRTTDITVGNIDYIENVAKSSNIGLRKIMEQDTSYSKYSNVPAPEFKRRRRENVLFGKLQKDIDWFHGMEQLKTAGTILGTTVGVAAVGKVLPVLAKMKVPVVSKLSRLLTAPAVKGGMVRDISTGLMRDAKTVDWVRAGIGIPARTVMGGLYAGSKAINIRRGFQMANEGRPTAGAIKLRNEFGQILGIAGGISWLKGTAGKPLLDKKYYSPKEMSAAARQGVRAWKYETFGPKTQTVPLSESGLRQFDLTKSKVSIKEMTITRKEALNMGNRGSNIMRELQLRNPNSKIEITNTKYHGRVKDPLTGLRPESKITYKYKVTRTGTDQFAEHVKELTDPFKITSTKYKIGSLKRVEPRFVPTQKYKPSTKIIPQSSSGTKRLAGIPKGIEKHTVVKSLLKTYPGKQIRIGGQILHKDTGKIDWLYEVITPEKTITLTGAQPGKYVYRPKTTYVDGVKNIPGYRGGPIIKGPNIYSKPKLISKAVYGLKIKTKTGWTRNIIKKAVYTKPKLISTGESAMVQQGSGTIDGRPSTDRIGTVNINKDIQINLRTGEQVLVVKQKVLTSKMVNGKMVVTEGVGNKQALARLGPNKNIEVLNPDTKQWMKYNKNTMKLESYVGAPGKDGKFKLVSSYDWATRIKTTDLPSGQSVLKTVPKTTKIETKYNPKEIDKIIAAITKQQTVKDIKVGDVTKDVRLKIAGRVAKTSPVTKIYRDDSMSKLDAQFKTPAGEDLTKSRQMVDLINEPTEQTIVGERLFKESPRTYMTGIGDPKIIKLPGEIITQPKPTFKAKPFIITYSSILNKPDTKIEPITKVQSSLKVAPVLEPMTKLRAMLKVQPKMKVTPKLSIAPVTTVTPALSVSQSLVQEQVLDLDPVVVSEPVVSGGGGVPFPPGYIFTPSGGPYLGGLPGWFKGRSTGPVGRGTKEWTVINPIKDLPGRFFQKQRQRTPKMKAQSAVNKMFGKIKNLDNKRISNIMGRGKGMI